MDDFTILHLSDLHVDESKGRPNILLDNLLHDIKSEMIYSKNILIVVTGDLINQAKYENKQRVIIFFQSLKDILGDKIKQIYIVPGNHDKVRSEMDSMVLYNYTSQTGTKPDSKDEWKYVRVSFEEHLELVKEIYAIFYDKPEERVFEDTYGVHIDTVNNKNICVIQFNTAWASKDDNDQRRLRIGKYQLRGIKESFIEAYDKLKGRKDIDLTIVLAHHPVNWLTGSEEDMVQDEILSQNGLNANVYICGHTHNRDVINWQNNRNSLTTLVSGLGWPDGSTQHPYAHTYSSYVFNLDVNSIDVYVRSSNDAYSFEPDFRIYTNQRNKENTKIVMPIDICRTQAYFNLGAPKSRSSKACYITEEIIRNLKIYGQIFTICEDSLRDRLETIKYDLIKDIDKGGYDANTLSAINDVLFFGKEGYEISWPDSMESHFEKSLSNFLTAICESFCKTILSFIPNAKLRMHFRRWNEKNDSYVQVASSGNLEQNYTMTPLEWGQLIKEAYESGTPLIASVNQYYCSQSIEHNTKKSDEQNRWSDFITVIPRFESNYYIRRDAVTETIEIARPILTFGVTVYREEDKEILYMLDYLNVDWFVGRQILKFMHYFPLDPYTYTTSLSK